MPVDPRAAVFDPKPIPVRAPRPSAEPVARLDFADGVSLFAEPDLMSLGLLANRVREARHGDRTYFNVNMHLNATNVCVADCKFCSFARLEEGMAGAYTMTLDEAIKSLLTRPLKSEE